MHTTSARPVPMPGAKPRTVQAIVVAATVSHSSQSKQPLERHKASRLHADEESNSRRRCGRDVGQDMR
jgi:hypothetical protein